jgi:hypothetical protein
MMTNQSPHRAERPRRRLSRRRSLTHTLLVTLLTCCVSSSALACSKTPYRTQVAPNDAFILGRAGTDTVLAGAGSVAFHVASGHFGPGTDRPIFALAIDVERVVGPAKRLLPARVPRVLIVPWDYGADCRPTPYARSARWVSEGVHGMFSATLRPKAEWVGGVPTLDVFTPELEPYPVGPNQQAARRREGADSALTLDDMLVLMDKLPDAEAMRRDPERASMPLYAWVRADTLRTRLYPVRQILSWVKYSRQKFLLRTVHHPVIGTFRFTLTTDGRAPVTIFARTEETPNGSWSHRTPHSDDPMVVQPWDLYDYLFFIAQSEEALPSGCGAYSVLPPPESYLYLFADKPATTRGIATYPAWIELNAFVRAFPADSALMPFDSLAFNPFEHRPVRLIGSMTAAPGGVTRFSQAETLSDGRRLVVTGERVSRRVIECEERR